MQTVAASTRWLESGCFEDSLSRSWRKEGTPDRKEDKIDEKSEGKKKKQADWWEKQKAEHTENLQEEKCLFSCCEWDLVQSPKWSCNRVQVLKSEERRVVCTSHYSHLDWSSIHCFVLGEDFRIFKTRKNRLPIINCPYIFIQTVSENLHLFR